MCKCVCGYVILNLDHRIPQYFITDHYFFVKEFCICIFLNTHFIACNDDSSRFSVCVFMSCQCRVVMKRLCTEVSVNNSWVVNATAPGD